MAILAKVTWHADNSTVPAGGMSMWHIVTTGRAAAVIRHSRHHECAVGSGIGLEAAALQHAEHGGGGCVYCKCIAGAEVLRGLGPRQPDIVSGWVACDGSRVQVGGGPHNGMRQAGLAGGLVAAGTEGGWEGRQATIKHRKCRNSQGIQTAGLWQWRCWAMDHKQWPQGPAVKNPSITERSLVDRSEEAPGLHCRRNQHIPLGDVCQAGGGDKLRHKGTRLGIPGVGCSRRRTRGG